jgi:LacI family transcriptional regulator
MTITIHDIAEQLGLSITTVSRALNNYSDISAATRERVIQTANQLGYSPNRAARQLRMQRAGAIGYILPASTPRFADPFFSEFISGLGDETAQHQIDLIISTAIPGSEAERSQYQHWIQGQKVDGVILDRMHLSDWRVQYLAEQCCHFVSLERSLDPVDYPSIEVDSKSGFIAMLAHLAGRRFQRIAYIGGPGELKIQADRLAGYQTGLAIAGLPYDPGLVLQGDLTSPEGYRCAKRLLSLTDPPDAILCINDETAFGVLSAAHEHGLVVGQQLAVAGFDGVQDAKHSQPPLTTLDQPVYEIARQLGKMLFAVIAGDPLPDPRVILQPTLLVRESTTGIRPA